jgi:hypothetical protein
MTRITKIRIIRIRMMLRRRRRRIRILLMPSLIMTNLRCNQRDRNRLRR